MQFETTLDDLLEEFRMNALDFEVDLLVLECLRSYWETEELQQRYPETVFLEARLTLCQFLKQHAQDLYDVASFLRQRCS